MDYTTAFGKGFANGRTELVEVASAGDIEPSRGFGVYDHLGFHNAVDAAEFKHQRFLGVGRLFVEVAVVHQAVFFEQETLHVAPGLIDHHTGHLDELQGMQNAVFIKKHFGVGGVVYHSEFEQVEVLDLRILVGDHGTVSAHIGFEVGKGQPFVAFELVQGSACKHFAFKDASGGVVRIMAGHRCCAVVVVRNDTNRMVNANKPIRFWG